VTNPARLRALLDTNIIVDVLRGRAEAVDVVRSRVANGDELCISVLTRFELRAGARPNELNALAEHLALYDEIDVDRDIAEQAGEFANTYRRSHTAIDPIDYIVAASAQLHAHELLTLNVKHFPMIANLRAPYRAAPTR
jgi:predicted nucleic acid-binding protein